MPYLSFIVCPEIKLVQVKQNIHLYNGNMFSFLLVIQLIQIHSFFFNIIVTSRVCRKLAHFLNKTKSVGLLYLSDSFHVGREIIHTEGLTIKSLFRSVIVLLYKS